MVNRKLCLTLVWLVSLGIVGCAAVNEKTLRLFSTRVNSFAVLNGQLFQGVIDMAPDRTGAISLESDGGNSVRCAGQMRYTGAIVGSVDLRCSDGSHADMQFNGVSEFSGFAVGLDSTDQASLTYGFAAQDALAMLRPPKGRKLVLRTGSEGLDIQ